MRSPTTRTGLRSGGGHRWRPGSGHRPRGGRGRTVDPGDRVVARVVMPRVGGDDRAWRCRGSPNPAPAGVTLVGGRDRPTMREAGSRPSSASRIPSTLASTSASRLLDDVVDPDQDGRELGRRRFEPRQLVPDQIRRRVAVHPEICHEFEGPARRPRVARSRSGQRSAGRDRRADGVRVAERDVAHRRGLSRAR